MSARPRVFLIDGNAFCYRAFYGVRPLSSSRGEPTQAVFGFVTMLAKIIDAEQPTHLAVCFDLGEPTFRHVRYVAYKATRKPMPDDLVRQLPRVKEVLRAYRITIYERAGFEADDLFGTLARRLEAKNCDVFIATSDKDALQLVSDHIKVYSAHREGEILDREKVRERFGGLGPEHVCDILALAGDSSDNIPGVPGVGEKTAVELIRRFGSAENVIKHAREIEGEARRKAIEENEDIIRLSKELATLSTDVDIDIDLDSLKLKEPDTEALRQVFQELEFRKFSASLAPASARPAGSSRHVKDGAMFATLVGKLQRAKGFAFATVRQEGNARRAPVLGLSFSLGPGASYYVPFAAGSRSPALSSKSVCQALAPLLGNSKVEKWGHALKEDLLALRRLGLQLSGPLFDVGIASYLVNPSTSSHTLEDVAFTFLGVRKTPVTELVGSGKSRIGMERVAPDALSDFACESADLIARAKPVLEGKLRQSGLEDLFHRVEMPLARVLARMEWDGVKVEEGVLDVLSGQCDRDLEALRAKIYREAGEEFNINSTKQLADILFGKLRLPVVKRIKTGYSTDVAVLEKLAESYEIPRLVLEYRERSKLQSTYLNAIPGLIDRETGRLHTSYHQTVTATGRLSSSDPNLQNIPIKSRLGREIRRAFVPRAKGRKLVSADYSQIELRLLAHAAGDPVLQKAFREGRDIHVHTASLLYGVKEKDVTFEMRTAAKTVNFSVLYGKTAFGLSKDLGMPVGQASDFIEAYFARYPRVSAYLEEQKERARRDGFVTTLLGRRAYFPDIRGSNSTLRAFAERAAVNAPLQGSAADLIKLAMVAIDAELAERHPDAHMILQVHDELVFDVPAAQVEAVSRLAKEKMEGALSLDVPTVVDTFVGDSWFKG